MKCIYGAECCRLLPALAKKQRRSPKRRFLLKQLRHDPEAPRCGVHRLYLSSGLAERGALRGADGGVCSGAIGATGAKRSCSRGTEGDPPAKKNIKPQSRLCSEHGVCWLKSRKQISPRACHGSVIA